MNASPATIQKMVNIGKVATVAAIVAATGSLVGAGALVFMVWRDTTPEGQANVAARQETARALSHDLVRMMEIQSDKEKSRAIADKENGS